MGDVFGPVRIRDRCFFWRVYGLDEEIGDQKQALKEFASCQWGVPFAVLHLPVGVQLRNSFTNWCRFADQGTDPSRKTLDFLVSSAALVLHAARPS